MDGPRPGHGLNPVAAALAVYAVLLAAAFTPVMEHLTWGRDESWIIALVAGAAHVWVGAAVGRAWVLALPVALCLVLFLADGAEGFAWLALIAGIPVGLLATTLGFLLRRSHRRAALVPLAVGLIGVGYGLAGWLPRLGAERLPRAVQAQLPLERSLGNLCSGAETPRHLVRDLRHRLRALVREVERHPRHLVTDTFYWSDKTPERIEITVREVAEEQLQDVEECAPDVRRTLEDALG